MEKYNIKGKLIMPHNILFAVTSPNDWEMTRLILLEKMPDCNYDEYVLVEGYHCSCYNFDETEWDCIKLTKDELNKILENEKYGLRKELKDFLEHS